MFTKATMEEARKRGYSSFDQILLVGGSTKMPQVKTRLEQEFGLPLKVFDPDEAVAKGAATYGYKLLIDQKIQHELAKELHVSPEEVNIEEASTVAVQRAQEKVARAGGMKLSAVQNFSEISVTNVSSHSFGVIVWQRDPITRDEKEVIANLIQVNDPVPASPTKTFGTYEANQEAVELKIVENTIPEEIVEDLTVGEQLGEALLSLPIKLPAYSPIEVTFELNREGRLHITGRDPKSGSIIEATFQTQHIASEEEIQAAKSRRVVVS
jgi:molecular chaperone DnaK (HSP70)